MSWQVAEKRIAFSQICRGVKSSPLDVAKDTMLDPESANMYTDSESSGDEDGSGKKLRSKKIRKGGAVIIRRPDGFRGDGDSDVDERESA